MRIGLVRRGYSASGGAEAYLWRLADGLQRRGHEAVLIGSPEWPADRWPGEEIVRVDGRGPLGFARRVDKASSRCDLLFSLERILRCDVYRAGDGVHRAWLDRRAEFEPRLVRAMRIFNAKHRILEKLEAQVLDPARTKWVIANSEMVKNEIRRYSQYPLDRVVVVRNGFDPFPEDPEARERMRSSLQIEGDRMVAVFAGSGWERKGLRHAIDAMRELPDALLVVAGRGRWQGDIPRNVRFLGQISDMPALLAAGDVFVLPTIYDPSSNACLEALASGMPVVTTNANGFAEILRENVEGSTVRPGDVAAIHRALFYWSDRGRRQQARSQCRALAAQYPVERNVRETLEVLGRCL